jgi:mannose-6-phosphate isomerase-like protein (cupin superfamily)
MQYVFSTKILKRYRFPTYINDIVMDRSESRFSEVFVVIIEPGKAPPLRKHNDTEQIFYVLEGMGTLVTGKETQGESDVIPGDVIRIPVSIWHSIRADKGVKLKYLSIDCFGSDRNENEPTWDSHVRVLCKEQGWDYEEVRPKSENENRK